MVYLKRERQDDLRKYDDLLYLFDWTKFSRRWFTTSSYLGHDKNLRLVNFSRKRVKKQVFQSCASKSCPRYLDTSTANFLVRHTTPQSNAKQIVKQF